MEICAGSAPTIAGAKLKVVDPSASAASTGRPSPCSITHGQSALAGVDASEDCAISQGCCASECVFSDISPQQHESSAAWAPTMAQALALVTMSIIHALKKSVITRNARRLRRGKFGEDG